MGTTSHLGGHFSRLVDLKWGFPDSPAGKESTYNARDPGSIPGSGRSTGEGRGYPLQYSWTSLLAQMVNNPPAIWDTWVQSLGYEQQRHYFVDKGPSRQSYGFSSGHVWM